MRRDGMVKMVTLAAVLLAAFALPALAFAQAGDDLDALTDADASRDDGTLYFGEYAVTEDGTLIIGGDVLVRCEEAGLLDGALPGAGDPSAQVRMEQLLREQIQACQAAGFPTASTSASASPSASASAPGYGSALPDTGGPALRPVLAMVVLCAAIAATASVLSIALAKRPL